MPTTAETLKKILVEKFSVAEENIRPEATMDTLGLDSLDMIEVLFEVEEAFDIRVPQDGGAIRTATVQQFMDTDTVFAGTPDDVFNQLQAFNARMGGVGHLLFFGQGGPLSHEDAKENIRLFGQEVAPRLRELRTPEIAAAE